ncbi:LysR family transcriptional regulator [Salinicola avicenniae]|uniref:LysR family transcriptional regulator n=1 Tax=Salinicola avicenniae TaxID=2916836 RepID=UPI0020730980|nr:MULTISPECIES: LysR family transcriptional regulator [unclassified Salinicola]
MTQECPRGSAPLNTRWLHYFHEAIDAGSIRAASDRLDIEPSVISRQIRQLEQALGTPLLERHGRGVRATEAGRLLMDFHRERDVAEQTLFGQLAALDGLQRGHISLAVSEGYSDRLMSGVMNDFCAHHPQLTVELNLVAVNEVVRQVYEGQAHIGIAYAPRLTPGIEAVASARQPLCAIVHPQHPLTRRPQPLALEDVLAWPLGLVGHGFGIRQLIDAVETMSKRHFHASLISNSLATLKQYVSSGNGVTFIGHVALLHEIRRQQLVALEIDHPIFREAESHVIVRQNRPLAPAARQLLDDITRLWPFGPEKPIAL